MDKETEAITESTRVIRVTKTAEEIALRYGSTVSKGIIEMEYKITHPAVQGKVMMGYHQSTQAGFTTANNTTPTSSSQTSSVQYSIVNDKEYWKKMQNTVETVISNYAGR
jgi:hypothetical protein